MQLFLTSLLDHEHHFLGYKMRRNPLVLSSSCLGSDEHGLSVKKHLFNCIILNLRSELRGKQHLNSFQERSREKQYDIKTITEFFP